MRNLYLNLTSAIYTLSFFIGCGGSTASSSSDFIASNGNVVMEAESSRLTGEWSFESILSGYTGTGYYEFNGNNICSGPATDDIRFSFKINDPGIYELRLKGAKVAHCVAWQNPGAHAGDTSTSSCNHEQGTCDSLALPNRSGNTLTCPDPTTQCLRQDISNDVYVSIRNSSDSYVAFINQPNNTIGDSIKLFGGQVDNWAWTSTKALDVSGNKWDARWNLASGVYTLVIEGRSKSFKLDRVVLFNTATSSLNTASSLEETR